MNTLTLEEKTAMIREAARNMRVMYQCCFCKQGIEGDTAAVVIVSKWNMPEEDQRSQQWFCHLACFEKTTNERFDAADEAREHIDAEERAQRVADAKWKIGGIEVTPEEGKAAFRAALGAHKGE